MLKSFHLGLDQYFQQTPSSAQLEYMEPHITMRYADKTYWKLQEEEAILQEFDGLQGHLYYVEFTLSLERYIPLRVDMADLHIFYVLSSDAPVVMNDEQTDTLCSLRAQRAAYLYLTPQEYQLIVPKGLTRVFGFYFRASIFRAGNERKYSFLHLLLDAHRSKSNAPRASIDFMVGPVTRLAIRAFCANLQAEQLDNEGYIMNKLIELIDLSREKVFHEENKGHYELRLAEQVQRLLTQYVELDGQMATLRKLGEDLGKTVDTLNRLHQKFFGRSLRSLRHALLVERAQNLLRSGVSPTECAYLLNYNSPEAFYHFFKKSTGKTPSQFQREVNR